MVKLGKVVLIRKVVDVRIEARVEEGGLFNSIISLPTHVSTVHWLRCTNAPTCLTSSFSKFHVSLKIKADDVVCALFMQLPRDSSSYGAVAVCQVTYMLDCLGTDT